MPKLTYDIPIVPMGKPRMTQRDRWKKRPVVVRYRAWCDELRLHVKGLPETHLIDDFSWTAVIPMPKSWSRKKRTEHCGQIHRSRPDRDNIDKAILDCLFKEDSGIGPGRLDKRWGETGRLTIEIEHRNES